jgi:hypothetical protein
LVTKVIRNFIDAEVIPAHGNNVAIFELWSEALLLSAWRYLPHVNQVDTHTNLLFVHRLKIVCQMC